ncbi:hypothetical protein B484DRAFT_408022, partial [Ochromonadaceae sp. CCMP2298]
QLVDVSTPSVLFDAAYLSGTDSLGLSLYLFNNNPTGAAVNSSQVKLQTSRYGTEANSPLSMPPFNVTLTNTENVDYSAFMGKPVDVVVACTQKPAAYTVAGTCPGGTAYAAQCPGDVGTVTVTCLGSQLVPQCLVLQGGDYSVSSSCSVLEYTATTTTCACSFPMPNRRLAEAEGTEGRTRRLQSDEDVAVSSRSTVVAGDVGGQEFAPSDTESSDSDTGMGAGVLAAIIVACVVFCGCLDEEEVALGVVTKPTATGAGTGAGGGLIAGAGARYKERTREAVGGSEKEYVGYPDKEDIPDYTPLKLMPGTGLEAS